MLRRVYHRFGTGEVYVAHHVFSCVFSEHVLMWISYCIDHSHRVYFLCEDWSVPGEQVLIGSVLDTGNMQRSCSCDDVCVPSVALEVHIFLNTWCKSKVFLLRQYAVLSDHIILLWLVAFLDKLHIQTIDQGVPEIKRKMYIPDHITLEFF